MRCEDDSEENLVRCDPCPSSTSHPCRNSNHREPPDHGFRLQAEDVLGSITGRTKAVILNSPNNPTGAVYDPEVLKKLAEGLRTMGILAISDEVYKEISFGARPDTIARYTDRCAVIDSFSKSFCLTGWRIGWCAVPMDLIKPLASFPQLAGTCVPAISQRAAAFALRGAADEERRRNLEELRRRRGLAMKCLAEQTDLTYVPPEGAFYLFVDVSDKSGRFGSSLDIALEFLKKERVVVIPGVAFGPRGEGYLRLSFAAEPADLEEGIRRLGRFLA